MSKIVKINANTIFITAMVSLNPFNNDKIWAPILIIAMLSLNPFYNDKIWAPQLFDLVRCQIKKELYLPIRTSVESSCRFLGVRYLSHSLIQRKFLFCLKILFGMDAILGRSTLNLEMISLLLAVYTYILNKLANENLAFPL